MYRKKSFSTPDAISNIACMNWNVSSFSAFPYPISEKGFIWRQHPEFDAKSGHEFAKLLARAIEQGKSVERDIKACIQKWPDVAGFQFLLAECLAYHSFRDADLVLDAMIDAHPSSFFTKIIQMANDIVARREEMENFAGGMLPELCELYPNREVFHVFEVHAYETLAVIVSLKRADYAKKEMRWERFEKLKKGFVHFKLQERVFDPLMVNAKDDILDLLQVAMVTEGAAEGIPASHIAALRGRIDASNADSRRGKRALFGLKITYELMDHVALLPDSLVSRLLAADRNALIADLEMILYCSILFHQKIETSLKLNLGTFHALLLLCHLEVVESLEAIRHFLSQEIKMLMQTLTAALTESLPTGLANLLCHSPQGLDSVILDPKANIYIRKAVIHSLVEVGLHYPERIPALEEQFLQLLAAANAASSSDNDIRFLNAHLAMATAYLRMPRMVDAMQPYYRQGEVDQEIGGDWEMLVEEAQNANRIGQAKNRHAGDPKGRYAEIASRLSTSREAPK